MFDRKKWMKEYNFEEVRLAQDNKCAICNIELNPKSHNIDSIHIDHNHTTTKFRGLLCSSCNIMLGYAKDNATILQKAIKYLNKSKSDKEC